MKRNKWRWLFMILVLGLALGLLLSVRSILSPFIAAFILAYLLSPLVEKLRQVGLGDKGAIAAVISGILIFFAACLFYLLPLAYQELSRIMLVLPGAVQNLDNFVQEYRANFRNSGLPAQVVDVIDGHMAGALDHLVGKLQGFLTRLPEMLSSAGLLVLSPVIAIYLLVEWQGLNKALIRLVPQRWRLDWQRLLQDINHVVRSFLRGNFIVALIVGILSGVGVKLLGLDYAFLIAVICAIADLIPYFGPLIGAVPALLLGLMQSPLMALKVALVLIVVQQLEGNIIAPKLMGDSVGLHPLWIIFSLLAGGELGGVWGMLLAVPVAAIIRVVLRHIFFWLVSPPLQEKS